MPRTPVPFGEFRPDLAQLDNQFASVADGVFTTLNSYQPIPSLQALSDVALPTGPALGLTPVRRLDGNWDVYGGTKTNLYKFSAGGWVDVTRTTTTTGNGTGTSTGTTSLTVASVTGTIAIGATVTGTGVPANTTVASQTSGTTGGAGVYVLSQATTLSGIAVTFTLTVDQPYNVPANELWSWAQFGTTLYACEYGDVLQAINVESGSVFANAPGSPPQAHNVQVIGDFLVLARLLTNVVGAPSWAIPNQTLIWCGINDPTNWVPGNSLCDFQIMPDGGPVLGVAGNETVAYVVQDRMMRLMQFLPGDINTIFNFTKILHDKGAVGEFCFRTIADVFYFIAEDGFYALAGSQLLPIGQDKVNNWLMNNSDRDRRSLYQILPTNRPYVAWAFYSTSAAPIYDRVIIYNWANQRWSTATVSAQVWAMLGQRPLDLDTTGTEPGDQYLDSPPAPLPPNAPQSLDSLLYLGGRPQVSAINAQGQLCALTGPNMAATLETAEAHLTPGQRTYVNNAYPLDDAASGGTITVSTRERLADAPVWGSPIPLEITGWASVTSSARLHRFQRNIPYGDTWTNAQGVIPDAQPDGEA